MTNTAAKAAAAILIAVGRAAAQELDAEKAEAVRPAARVVVSILDCKLVVLGKDGRIEKVFSVAVGAPVSPSPRGTFTVTSRIPNPTYYHPGKVIGPGKANPLGTRWIGLSVKGFGIHGTNVPRSIGKAASHGCIRLRNRDVEELFGMLQAGDVVELRWERDEVVSRLFGGEVTASAPAPAEAPAPAAE